MIKGENFKPEEVKVKKGSATETAAEALEPSRENISPREEVFEAEKIGSAAPLEQ